MIPAVQRVRETALRTESQNNLRQIALATQHFAAARHGRLPSIDGNRRSPNVDQSLFTVLLPYVEQGTGLPPLPFLVKTFISPADPTIRTDAIAPCSYAANAQVFDGVPNMQARFRDGLSNTIAFAEHYAVECGGPRPFYGIGASFLYADTGCSGRRATFSDGGPAVGEGRRGCGDLWPETRGQPPVSRAVSGISVTFQTAPRVEECHPILAQTPHPSGMLVALGDGSVRTLAPGISPAAYWGAVTPASGDVLGEDW